jgi:hypothetical protein
VSADTKSVVTIVSTIFHVSYVQLHKNRKLTAICLTSYPAVGDICVCVKTGYLTTPGWCVADFIPIKRVP